MVMIRAFLNTSLLVGKVLNLSDRSNAVIEDENIIKYTNESLIPSGYDR